MKTDNERWNKTCDSMDNDISGDRSLYDVEEALDDDPDGLLYQALMKMLKDGKKKSLMIVRG